MNVKSNPGAFSYPENLPAGANLNPLLIQQALEEILLSTPFRTTRQCQDFLRYVVANTLAGLDHVLRERVIGAEVFGRKPDYDTSEDPVVRLRAADVRKRLAQYYQSANLGTSVRIDIPSGSYRATFEWIVPPEALTALVPVEGAIEVVKSEQSEFAGKFIQSKWPWIAVIVISLIGLGVYRQITRVIPGSGFSQFWAPILGGSKPVLICMGSNAVYRLSGQFMMNYMQENHLENNGMEFFVALNPDTKIEARNLQRAYNSFVALGDVGAVSDIVATLTRQGKPFQQRFPPDISFAELQNTPTISIGGFNNPLTITLTKDLRFALAAGSRVEDHKTKQEWVVKPNGDSHDTEDYAVISRLMDSKSGGPILSIAGIGQYGTQAAAEFISDPKKVGAVMKAAPKGWNERNLQLVLHVRIVNYRPVSTEIIASQYW